MKELPDPILPNVGEPLTDLDSLILQIKHRGFKIITSDEPYLLVTGHRTNIIILADDPEKLLLAARAALVEERKTRGRTQAK